MCEWVCVTIATGMSLCGPVVSFGRCSCVPTVMCPGMCLSVCLCVCPYGVSVCAVICVSVCMTVCDLNGGIYCTPMSVCLVAAFLGELESPSRWWPCWDFLSGVGRLASQQNDLASPARPL